MAVKKIKFHGGVAIEGNTKGINGTNNNSKCLICGQELAIITKKFLKMCLRYYLYVLLTVHF